MHHYFELFNKICTTLDLDTRDLRKILNEYDFKTINQPFSPLANGRKHLETVYLKEEDVYRLTIKLSTGIKYASSSGEQEDAYYITVSLSENENIINSKTYTCHY